MKFISIKVETRKYNREKNDEQHTNEKKTTETVQMRKKQKNIRKYQEKTRNWIKKKRNI